MTKIENNDFLKSRITKIIFDKSVKNYRLQVARIGLKVCKNSKKSNGSKTRESACTSTFVAKGANMPSAATITRGEGKSSAGVDIDQRPDVVATKERFGDLEGDTIIGKNHKGAIATFNDR